MDEIILNEVKKEIEDEALETKKANIKRMLLMIRSFEKVIEDNKKEIAKINEEIEREDFSRLRRREALCCSTFGNSAL